MTSRATVKLAVVEDESLFRDLLLRGLREHEAFDVVGDFADANSALTDIPGLEPDVVVLDIDLGPGMTGVELGVRLKRTMPGLGVLLLSNVVDPQLLTSIPSDVLGGWSYLLKRSVSDLSALARAIEGAADGLMVLDRSLARRTSPRRENALSNVSP